MTTQRADIIRQACKAWGEGDLTTIRDLYADDVIADGGELWPEGAGSVQGRDAVLGAFESIMRAFDSSELIPEGYLEVGDTLVVPLLWRGRLPDSQSFIEQRLVGSYGFRGEHIAEIRWFASMESALEALRLAPDSAARVIR